MKKIITILFILIGFNVDASQIATGLDGSKIQVVEYWKKCKNGIKNFTLIENRTDKDVVLTIRKVYLSDRDTLRVYLPSDTLLTEIKIKAKSSIKKENLLTCSENRKLYVNFFFNKDNLGIYHLKELSKPEKEEFGNREVLVNTVPNLGSEMNVNLFYSNSKLKKNKPFFVDVEMIGEELQRAGLPECHLCSYNNSPCSTCNPDSLTLKITPVSNLEIKDNRPTVFQPKNNFNPPYIARVEVQINFRRKSKISYFSYMYFTKKGNGRYINIPIPLRTKF